MGRGFWISSVVVAMLAVGLPCLGTFVRRQRLPQCALDGVVIDPEYRVEIVAADGTRRSFCCILCADFWLAREPAPLNAVYVTDEISARQIDAADAFFVQSSVVTNAVTKNRTHCFAERRDAEAHAKQFRGRLLLDGERPFAGA
jgi:hypothetical protein